ncbi:hypothetical protein K1719_001690 [Acacia pycnantha]|nr:hypothetical protein K1719_001690 [Acacia pycnantha]
MDQNTDIIAPHSTGTTIIGVTSNGGVVLGAGFRTSTGVYVANRASGKISQLTDNVYVCRSGSGCNLAAQRDNNRFFFIDMLMCQCPDDGKIAQNWLTALFEKIEGVISSLHPDSKNFVTITIDDVSLFEVAANGSSNDVLDFLHYCLTLTSEFVREAQCL